MECPTVSKSYCKLPTFIELPTIRYQYCLCFGHFEVDKVVLNHATALLAVNVDLLNPAVNLLVLHLNGMYCTQDGY